MVYYICHCLSLHVCLGANFILDSPLAISGEENVVLAFCLYCFVCGAVTLNASFFPFGVLKRKV